jgi:hypothetical protein
MSARRLLILAILAVLVIAGALWLASQRNLPRSVTAQSPVLPALEGSINEVTELHVVAAGDKSMVTLKRDEKFWRVMERDGYPADAGKLRKLLIDLGDLAVVEEKTSNPESYAKLGVEDLTAPTASGVRLDLLGLEKPVSLIVGKSAGGDSAYVRVAGSAPSLQAKPQLSVEREAKNWLERSIFDIAPEKVQEVRLNLLRAASYTITRAKQGDADFTVPALPKGKTLSSPTAANPVGSALSGLSLDDVHRAPASEDWTKDVQRAEYRLFDGTIITVNGRKDGDKNLIRLAVAFDDAQHQRFAASTRAAPTEKPAAATRNTATPTPAEPAKAAPTVEELRANAASTAARVEGWVYEIPAYKFETIFQPLDDLLSKT